MTAVRLTQNLYLDTIKGSIGQVLDISPDEAATLTELGSVVYVSAPPAPELARNSQERPRADETGLGEEPKEEAPEPEEAQAELVQPKPYAPKHEWVDHAVAKGADPEMAARMTKADLMSGYGSRL